MNFPALNTDSFYKFITILGLVIVAFCSNIIADRFTESRNMELKYYSDSLTLSCEIENLKLDKELLLNKQKETYNIDSIDNEDVESLNVFKLNIDKISNTIALKKGLIVKYRTEKQDSYFYLNFIIRLFTIIWFVGTTGLLWGFIEWYRKQQKLKDKELLRDYINLGQISMVCNSCGAMMTKDTIRPKEKDGSYNYIFCCDCYANGEFKDPDISLNEMKNKIGRKYKCKTLLWFRLLWIEKLQRWK